MPKKIKRYIIVWCFLIIFLMLLKFFVLPLFYQKSAVAYTQSQISALEKSIKTSVQWQQFYKIFPHNVTVPSMPNYYEQGESYPVFLCVKDIYYEGDLTIDAWLFARVNAQRQSLAFEHCILRIYFKKNGAVFNAATLNKSQTEQILQAQSEKEFLDYLKSNFFDPATFSSN